VKKIAHFLCILSEPEFIELPALGYSPASK